MRPTNSLRQREIRVFISSTFRDMYEEREELVKQIFPQLRRLCESRGVTWGEVDLRWGVTDEARAEGNVLPLCLAEIERCRPYFIGLLGERYGWVPEEIPKELLEAQPWLNGNRKQSVTAIEILHGVLLNPEMADHSFFYFRDPSYASAHAGFTEEDPARRERLAALKNEIRKSRFPVFDNFGTPKELGENVLRDLTSVIEKDYPDSTPPDPLDRAAAYHEAYAATRRGIYIGRREYIEQLDAYAAGDGPQLAVLGESGGGKSALLANWTQRWREQHPETPVLVHFIGASPDSADWIAMLRRLLGEFQRLFHIQIEIPDQPETLRMVFANALHMVAARGRIVLVVDALNQIEDRDGAPDLIWMPPVIPANVRLVVSTLPGRPLDALYERGWSILVVEPLEPPERETLIVEYLRQYAKELSRERRQRIAAAPQSANGMYLTTLLNELRLFGSHDQLDQRIGWYLEAANPLELYGKVLQRWEHDYGKPHPECPDLVRKSLSLLWAARRGLSEIEMLELLGSDGLRLPRVVWSPFFLAAGDALVNRGGLLTFAHDFLRKAARQGCLPATDDGRNLHHTLAEYFAGQAQGPRQLDELPWQLQEAREWTALGDLLARPAFLGELWAANQFEVKAYWTRIESESPIRMAAVYAETIENPTRDIGHAWMVGILLADTGKTKAALGVRTRLTEYFRMRGDTANLSASLGNQAVLQHDCGDLDGAMTLNQEQEHLCRELGDKSGLSKALINQARDLRVRGDLDRAMALYKEGEDICRELSDNDGLQSSLGGQALICRIRGDFEGALALHRVEERINRELGNTNELAYCLGNQALIHTDRGELDRAITLYKEEERLCRELGNKDCLAKSLGNQAMIYSVHGDAEGAIALLRESERLCREIGYKDGLANSLGTRALILKACGDLDGALSLHKEEELLCRELGNKQRLAGSIGNQAVIEKNRGNLDGAMALHKEAENLFRELGSPDGLLTSLANQATILLTRGDTNGAMTLFRESERLCRELENKRALQAVLGNQAVVFHAVGDLNRALALQIESEHLCRELDYPEGLACSLANQAAILRGVPGRGRGARQLVDKALAIATQYGYWPLVPQFQSIRDSISSGDD